MPLGMEVGLGTNDIVLDGDAAPPTKSGTAALPNFFGHKLFNIHRVTNEFLCKTWL